MDLVRKKIIIINLKDLIATASGKDTPEDVTDFRIRKEVLDRLVSLRNISRVIITHDLDEKAYMPQLKAVEFFVFVYCKTAALTLRDVSCMMDRLPHNQRKREHILSLDPEAAELLEVESMTIEEFLS